MQIHVVLTGPPRVVLGRSAVDLTLPGDACTLGDVLRCLADSESRIARYLQGADGQLPVFFRALVNDRPLEPTAVIPDGATLTLVYAVAGGSCDNSAEGGRG
jgi:hypothetical protein